MKELLSPAGNMECLKAAVNNGADAIYLGGKTFGARAYAGNFSNEELKEAVNYAHLYGVKIYITVNTIIYNNEVDELIKYIEYLYKIGVDALIMQDIGMISLVRKVFPNMEVHASTQCHNHNYEGIKLLKELGVTRIVLDREMSLEEIENIDVDIEKEVFIHGALCNCYSGCCLFSFMNGGRSGNRGECTQVCRLPFKLIKNGKYIDTPNKYLLSTKELNTISNFDKLLDSDIVSFKIEGRMKSPSYVGYVTRLYRKLIDNHTNKVTSEEENNLKILFNRDFTSGYLFNDKVMNTSTSNHQGLEIGRVLEVTPKKIKIKVTNNLYQEDGIRFKNSNLGMIANFIYNEKDLLINTANKGDIIYLDNKINLKEKDILIKTSSGHLDEEILSTSEKKIIITIDVLQINDYLEITFKDNNGNKVSDRVKTEVPQKRPTTNEEIKEMILSMCKDRILKIVEKHEDADFVYVNDLGRHRVNIYFQQGYMTAAIRIINEQIKTLEELNLPDVLHKLALLPRGLVLVTGPTGSGKSTVVNLIPRFYDVTKGEILIDGVNIKDVTQKELRSVIGFVPQKGVLFSGTIESNIKYSDENMSDDKMKLAAEISQATEFIDTKNDKYKSEIAQGGSNVSGGQKQRLSIARAIAKDPEIFVFDDSFSALDYKTDAKLRTALSEKTQNKTVIIVAQRINTVLNADQIIVLDDGKIAGKGTHKELMQNCEVYKQIALSQLSAEELE